MRDKPETARALWMTAPGKMEIRNCLLSLHDGHSFELRALYSGVSRGTESLVLSGEVPGGLHDAMRAPFQEGGFSFPLKYGYALVGEVDDGAAGTRRVFCLHPHQDRTLVPEDAIVDIPEYIPTRRAVLAANMETALNGIWDSGTGPGDRISVIGAGIVGLLTAILANRIPGAEVTLVDTDPAKAHIARTLGIPFAAPEEMAKDQDCIFHTSGNPAGLQTAIDHTGQDGTVIEMSWYGTKTAPLSLGGNFHPGRITIQSSQVGKIPPVRTPRWTYKRRLAKALSLLNDPVLDHLTGPDIPFEDAPERLPDLLKPGSGALCPVIIYQGSGLIN